MTKVFALFQAFFFIPGRIEVLSQDVFSPGIGRARVSPVVPHLYGLPSVPFKGIDSVAFCGSILKILTKFLLVLSMSKVNTHA